MRTLLPAATLLLAAACVEPAPGVQLRAELNARTSGVALHDDGLFGAAAMADQLCLFDANAGEIVGDVDIPGEGERLLDAHGTMALAASDAATWLVPRDIAGEPKLHRTLHALDGRLLDDGAALLHAHEGQCAVTFTGASGRTSLLTQLDCTGDVGFTADRSGGTVFIADGTDVLALDASGRYTAFQGANIDLLTWNEVTSTLVGARVGESSLYAWTPDGTALWQRELPGTAVDLDIAGAEGFVAVMVSDNDGGGTFMMIDGEDGAPLVSWPTPSIAEVSVSADGGGLALSTEEGVYLYDVARPANPLGLPTTREAAALQPLVGEDGMVSTGTAAGTGAAVVGTAALVALMAD